PLLPPSLHDALPIFVAGRAILGNSRPMRNSLFLIALASAVLLACGPARRPFDPSSAGGPTYVDPPGVHLEDTHITIDDTIQFAQDRKSTRLNSSHVK